MAKLLLVLVISLSVPIGCSGQSWQLVDTIHVNEEITCYSLDNQNILYIGTSSGNLHKFNENGSEHELYSVNANFPLTSIATWNRLKVFLFYKNLQEFYYLDRFNTFSNSYDLSEFSSELVNACTPGLDNSLWVLGSSYNELRKYNLQTQQLMLSNPLSLKLEDVTHMRAFQNLMIISDRQAGLHLFDQFGNVLSQLPLTGIDYFEIRSGKVVCISDQGIVTLDPFNPDDYKAIKAPEGAFKGLLKSDTNYFLIGASNILVYRSI